MKALRNTVEHHKSIRFCRPVKSGRPCDVCGGKPTHRTEVATSWMRGEDELYLTCDEHTFRLLKTGELIPKSEVGKV